MLSLKDTQGKDFQLGQKVARAYTLNAGGSCEVRIETVTRIENGKLYLNDSRVAIKFPDRLTIVS